MVKALSEGRERVASGARARDAASAVRDRTYLRVEPLTPGRDAMTAATAVPALVIDNLQWFQHLQTSFTAYAELCRSLGEPCLSQHLADMCAARIIEGETGDAPARIYQEFMLVLHPRPVVRHRNPQGALMDHTGGQIAR